jgi:hypothetical protein
LAAKACQRRSSYTVPGLPALISQSGSHEAGIVGPVCCFDFATRNLSSSLLVAFTSPHVLMTRGSSINVRIFADDRGAMAQCLDLPIDLLGTAGAELAVKLAASLVRIRFVPVHDFSPTYCVQQHFRRGPGLCFNAESASNNRASSAPSKINSFNAFTVPFIC